MAKPNEIRQKNENEASTLMTAGFISSILLASVTLLTFIMAVLTPPISGPFSAGASVAYPYTNVISRFPRDYYWMYPAMLLVLIYVFYMVCVDQYAGRDRKTFSRTALVMACLSAGIIFVDYFVQVTVIQPSLINGEFDAIALLTQYNPHGLFIALEEAGYLLMALSFLFLAPVFNGGGAVQTGIRWITVLSFLLTLFSLVALSVIFGIGREYRFEVAVITIDFFVLILLGILSGILFRQGRGC